MSVAAAGNADALPAVERNSGEAFTFSRLAHLAFVPKFFFRCVAIDMRARQPSFTSAAFMQSITAMRRLTPLGRGTASAGNSMAGPVTTVEQGARLALLRFCNDAVGKRRRRVRNNR